MMESSLQYPFYSSSLFESEYYQIGHIYLATYQASIIVRFLLSRGAGGRIEDITPVSHRLVSDGSMVSSIAKLVERDSALPSS